MAVIFHLDLDAFFASVEQRDNPALRGKPVVVGADPKGGHGRGVVSTCSYEARKFGIHSAMPISIAYRLCPTAIFLPVNGKKYHQASQQVFQIMYDFTPDIEPISIDEAFLDMTGSCHLFGTPVEAARLLKERIKREVGLTASIGIAPVKMIAKIASDYGKPDGLLEILPGKVLEFLRPLAVERLWGVGPKTKEALAKLGIKTIGELAQLSQETLYQIFGESGLHLHNLANGLDPRAVQENDTIKSVSHEYTFDQDTSDQKQIEKILLDLSEQVSRRLRQAKLKGKTLTIKVRLEGFKTYTRAETLAERTNFSDVIYIKAKEHLKEFYQSGKKVRLIGVRVSNFDDLYVQESLFSMPGDDRREKIHQVLDRIKDKFGEDAIHRGS